MNNRLLILTILLLVSFSTAFAQGTDRIIKISGDTLKVNVTSISESNITYTFPKETVVTTINKKIVKQVIYKSGRTENISEPILISGEQDYAKVLITKYPNDVLGLTRKGEVQGKARKIYGSEDKLRLQATDNLKKEAAKTGAFIVLVQTDNFSMTPFNTVSMAGVAYGY